MIPSSTTDPARERRAFRLFMLLAVVLLGAGIGLDKNDVLGVLQSDAFGEAVEGDVLEAQRLGLRGVPFFVMDRKYGVSGAQPVEAFVQTLNKAYEVWRQEHPVLEMQKTEGAVCTPEGACD